MKQLFQFIKHPICTNVEYQICNSVTSWSQMLRFQNDLQFMMSWMFSKTLHLVAPWCCFKKEPVDLDKGPVRVWFLMEGFAILKHVVIPQYVPTTNNCPRHLSKRRKKKVCVGCSSKDRAGFKWTCRAGWTSGWVEVYQTYLLPIFLNSNASKFFSSLLLWLDFEQKIWH